MQTTETAPRVAKPITHAGFAIRCAGIRLVLPSTNVTGVVSHDHPTFVPRTPTHILGLRPHGEGALAIVDTARILGLGESTLAGAPENQRVVIVQSGTLEAGLLCDAALGVVEVPAELVDHQRLLTAGRLAEFVQWEFDDGTKRAGWLNVEVLLEAARFKGARDDA